MLLKELRRFFSKIEESIGNNILWVVEAMMRSGSANTSQLALALSQIKQTSYKTSDMAIYRLLSNAGFKVGEIIFRCYINLILAMLKEIGRLKKGEKIYVQVDFTSERAHFLVLVASVLCCNKAIPLYFSIRKYPKKQGQYDHKKLEGSFIRALRHYLPKRYKYVILADRGFGNERFIKLCEEAKFEYLIRLEPNLKIAYKGQKGIMSKQLRRSGSYQVEVLTWKKTVKIYKNKQQGQEWYIVSNLEISHQEGVASYAKRFRIEKLFQDLKSSGFNLEESKIRKYDRFKRLLFICCLAYSLMLLLGNFIDKELSIKKKLTNIYKPFNSLFQLAKKAFTYYTSDAYLLLGELISRLNL
jgi:hypothetical protein